MIENIIFIILILCMVTLVPYGIWRSLNTPFDWEEEFWKELIENDLKNTSEENE